MTNTLDNLLTNLSTELARQSSYVSNERANLTTLSLAVRNGELYGSSLAGLVRNLSPAEMAAAAARPANPNDRPLIVIRFDDPEVDFAQQLYTVLSAALERRPDALFDLVAVAPNSMGGAGDRVRTASQAPCPGCVAVSHRYGCAAEPAAPVLCDKPDRYQRGSASLRSLKAD